MITRWRALIVVVGVLAYAARTVLAPFIIAAALASIISPLVAEAIHRVLGRFLAGAIAAAIRVTPHDLCPETP